MKVYLCGPMTGLPEFNYPAFHDAAQRLRAKGYEVLSPAERRRGPRNQPNEDVPWTTFLRRGLRQLLKSDSVVVLDGWQDSRGASLEVHVARELGMPVQSFDDAVSTQVASGFQPSPVESHGALSSESEST